MDGNGICMMIPDNCRGRAEGRNGLGNGQEKVSTWKAMRHRQSQMIIMLYNQG